MLKQIISAMVMFTALIGCGAKTRVEEVGPRISHGYYRADDGDTKKNLPMVAIKMEGGRTYAYSLLKYNCEGKTVGEFSYSGVTFSSNPVSAGGPSLIASGCHIDTKISAHAPNSIEVEVSLNGAKQTYLLQKVNKEQFIAGLTAERDLSDVFTITDETCQKALGTDCTSVQLSSKRQ